MSVPARPAPGANFMHLWNWASITSETLVFRSNETMIALPATGGVLAIHVQRRNIDDPYPANLHGEDYRAKFTLHNDPSMWDSLASFEWGYPEPDCGIGFHIPIPNLNASHPLYLLRNSPEQCPDLTVTITSLRQK